MQREEALNLMEENIKQKNLRKHCLAVEAVMAKLADYFEKDKHKWRLAGLLHDIDVEVTDADSHTHALKAEELLSEYDLDDDMLDAIRMHNEIATGKQRSAEFQYALAAGETITGLIYATALVYPDKKIEQVKYKSVKKRMKSPAFAASVKRENIMECEKIGIPLDEFIQISVDAMREIHEEIGL